MTKLLALETSGAQCSVAAFIDGVAVEDTQKVERLHNQVLLRQIETVTGRAGLAVRDFTHFAFGAGPGSFTGVRIAAATAQALAYAAGGLVIPVPSSRALALAARQSPMLVEAPGVVTVVRSRRDAYYLAAHRFLDVGAEQLLNDALHLGIAAPALGMVAGWPAVGDRPDWWDLLTVPGSFVEGVAPTAAGVGQLAIEIAAAGEGLAPQAGLPIYVDGDTPWQPTAPESGPHTR